MRCLYCGTPLAIMRMVANGSFCCDEHRDLYERQTETPCLAQEVALARPASRSGAVPIAPVAPICVGAPIADVVPDRPDAKALAWHGISEFRQDAWPPLAGKVTLSFAPAGAPSRRRAAKNAITAAPFSGVPAMPRLDIAPAPIRRAVQPNLNAAALQTPARRGLNIDLSKQKLRDVWQNAPGDLKIIAMVIPLILLLTLNAAGPRLYTRPVAIRASGQPAIDGIISRHWQAFRRSIARRAGIDLIDDFRSGLDAWTLGSGKEATWAYDNMGFVRPGALALYQPTVPLVDYEVDFIARIEQKGLGFAFRASGPSNYEAVRLVVTRSGPLPEVHVVRYAVVNGRESARSDKPLPFRLDLDAFFNVHLGVRGSDFTLMVQDKMADFWTDDRLKTGGVGFFCGKGESARVRRIEVSHQNDTLGRFCAYIATDGVDNKNGS